MSSSLSKPVVVGVDGSDASRLALAWAADEAVRRQVPLRIVHAFIWPLMRVPLGPPDISSPPHSGLRGQATWVLDQAAEQARDGRPGLVVETDLPVGAAGQVMVAESEGAQLLVLGSRGLGGFTGLVVGSTTVQVSAHAACPVVVVPPEAPGTPDGPVVVGVDGSEESANAIGFAFEQAQARGARLVAVHSWRVPVSPAPGAMLPLVYDLDVLEEEERQLLAESMAGWQEKYPDVVVERRTERGQASKVLLAAAESAQLLVVGSRGRGGFRGLMLGSTSQTVLHHAPCPLAITRQPV